MKRLVFAGLFLLGVLAPQAHATDTVYYIHTDALGSPVAITDANRNVVERTQYAPYGQVLNRPEHDGPGYTGHEEDAATGLTNMQQRYDDKVIGRFLSVDPVQPDGNTGGSFNRYAYANDNPYRYTDPFGLKSYDCTSSGSCPSQMKLADLKVGDVIKTNGATITVGKSDYKVTFTQGITRGAEAAKTGPVLVPQGPKGANVKANEAQASKMSPFEFRDQVKNKGPWDYKQEGHQYEAFGNFNYGATGKAAGFSEGILLQEAGRAQVAAGTSRPQWGSPGIRLLPFTGRGNFGDDPVDQYWIEQGTRYESH